MIVALDADVALVAMRGSRWTVDVACCAEFYTEVVGFCCDSVEFQCVVHFLFTVISANRNLCVL